MGNIYLGYFHVQLLSVHPWACYLNFENLVFLFLTYRKQDWASIPVLRIKCPSWITALLWRSGLPNSMKLWAMPGRVTQDGQVIVKSSDKMWSTRGGNGKPLQYSCWENSMNSMKRQKRYDTEGGVPQVDMLLGKSRVQLLMAPLRMKRLDQSGNDA